MEPPDIQFVGPPCGHHGSYTFYRAFKFTKGQKTKVLSLGQFFFAKITPDAPVCIGDVQLVWHHKNHDGQPLCSVRLYFLPEDTPDGRLACHGEV
ncbi:AT-rich interactive domain-containing protein 5B [Lamellibrachia satsuma]|nr:AT-rich interactive domain-containing protein 5B [Lamellibrachia satsuma]